MRHFKQSIQKKILTWFASKNRFHNRATCVFFLFALEFLEHDSVGESTKSITASAFLDSEEMAMNFSKIYI